MDDAELRKILEGFRVRLQELVQEKEKVERRRNEISGQIAGLQQSVTGLQAYVNAAEDNGFPWREIFSQLFTLLGEAATSWSLTEFCRQVLKQAAKPLCAAEVKELVERSGFSFAMYQSNPVSSVSTTLKRLVDAGEARECIPPPEVGGEHPTKIYAWDPPPHVASQRRSNLTPAEAVLPPPTFPGRYRPGRKP